MTSTPARGRSLAPRDHPAASGRSPSQREQGHPSYPGVAFTDFAPSKGNGGSQQVRGASHTGPSTVVHPHLQSNDPMRTVIQGVRDLELSSSKK